MIRFISEYRDKAAIGEVIEEVRKIHSRDIVLMEVCGGHTMSLHKNGIPGMLPPSIKLLSGPGCPVCVTSRYFIDEAVDLGKRKDTIITTFGDLLRVPGKESTLEREKAEGRDIRIVYSSLEALETARENPSKQVIFLGIGFETTTPSSAAAVIKARETGIKNFHILSAHKVMPPAMSALIEEGIRINGYICPGHVSTITGYNLFKPLVDNYRVGCVVSGFEPLDLLQSIYMLVKQFENGTPALENQYSRVVTAEGNLKAAKLVKEVFEPSDDWWRGLGIIPASGLSVREEYEDFDAYKAFSLSGRVRGDNQEEEKGCRCGEILKGLIDPPECPLFSTVCSPQNPVGACMVSSEGTCAAWYKYSGRSMV